MEKAIREHMNRKQLLVKSRFFSFLPVECLYYKTIGELIEYGKYDSPTLSENIIKKITPKSCEQVTESSKKLWRYSNALENDKSIVRINVWVLDIAGETKEEISKKMDNAGFRPATLPEVLCFGALYPERQRGHRLLSFGTIKIDDYYEDVVYSLSGSKYRRIMSIYHSSRDRNIQRKNPSFLAVSKHP
jgi:hypothetical protein